MNAETIIDRIIIQVDNQPAKKCSRSGNNCRSVEAVRQGSGTFLAKGAMKPARFQLYVQESCNVFQLLLQLTY